MCRKYVYRLREQNRNFVNCIRTLISKQKQTHTPTNQRGCVFNVQIVNFIVHSIWKINL